MDQCVAMKGTDVKRVRSGAFRKVCRRSLLSYFPIMFIAAFATGNNAIEAA
jgi:hypothetical protein